MQRRKRTVPLESERPMSVSWAEEVPGAPYPATVEDLEAWPDDGYKYELVDGRLVRMPHASGGHSTLALDLGAELRAYVRPRRMGEVTGADGGYKLLLPGRPKDQLLAPDVGFVRAGRHPERGTRAWFQPWLMVPDLVVEVASPRQDLQEKLEEWLSVKVPLIWLIFPEARRVQVWHHGVEQDVLGMADFFDGLDVVPGFLLPVRDIL